MAVSGLDTGNWCTVARRVVRPSSDAFYAPNLMLLVNTLLFAGRLARAFSIRKEELRVGKDGDAAKNEHPAHTAQTGVRMYVTENRLAGLVW